MERLNADIGSTDRSLEQAPEILQTVCVYAPINVLNRMVDELMNVLGVHALIGVRSISKERRVSSNVLSNERLKLTLANTHSNFASYFSTFTLQYSPHWLLSLWACRSDATFLFGQVHIASFATNESFIGFNFASGPTEFHHRTPLQSQAKSMQH